jgi:hypothetical protein
LFNIYGTEGIFLEKQKKTFNHKANSESAACFMIICIPLVKSLQVLAISLPRACDRNCLQLQEGMVSALFLFWHVWVRDGLIGLPVILELTLLPSIF